MNDRFFGAAGRGRDRGRRAGEGQGRRGVCRRDSGRATRRCRPGRLGRRRGGRRRDPRHRGRHGDRPCQNRRRHPAPRWDAARLLRRVEGAGPTIPLVAVPTTSGTGSELTPSRVDRPGPRAEGGGLQRPHRARLRHRGPRAHLHLPCDRHRPLRHRRILSRGGELHRATRPTDRATRWSRSSSAATRSQITTRSWPRSGSPAACAAPSGTEATRTRAQTCPMGPCSPGSHFPTQATRHRTLSSTSSAQPPNAARPGRRAPAALRAGRREGCHRRPVDDPRRGVRVDVTDVLGC